KAEECTGIGTVRQGELRAARAVARQGDAAPGTSTERPTRTDEFRPSAGVGRGSVVRVVVRTGGRGAGVARWGRVAAGGACGPGSRRWPADRDLVRFTRTRVWGRPAGGFGAGPGRSRSCRVAGAGAAYRERTAVPCPVR